MLRDLFWPSRSLMTRDLTDSRNLAMSGLRNRKSELTILASSVPTVAEVWSPCEYPKAL